MNNLIDFLTQFLGEYHVQTYQVTNKIVTSVSGQAVNVETVKYNCIPDGVGAWDIEYLTRFILLMFILVILYKIPKWTLQIINNASNRKIRLK